LHLFAPDEAGLLCSEIIRILRPGGIAIVDFSYDIKRILPNGESLTYPNEHHYTEQEGLGLVADAWKGNRLDIFKGEAQPMAVSLGEVEYTYSSKGFLFKLTKIPLEKS
jgi:hypothetical protein